MPRRRKITIRASELESFEALVRELQQRPEFAGFDPSSLHVWAYERYEPKLKDADAILRRFDYWLGVHKSERYLMANGSRLFNKKELAEALGVGEPTLNDIVAELCKPGRDVRDSLPKPLLRSDVMGLDDLKPGMELTGTVRNVIDFGAFVDLGVHQDGLVHVSQISDKFIKHPREVLKVGDIVRVKVLNVDTAKKRIALTMKGVPQQN